MYNDHELREAWIAGGVFQETVRDRMRELIRMREFEIDEMAWECMTEANLISLARRCLEELKIRHSARLVGGK